MTHVEWAWQSWRDVLWCAFVQKSAEDEFSVQSLSVFLDLARFIHEQHQQQPKWIATGAYIYISFFCVSICWMDKNAYASKGIRILKNIECKKKKQEWKGLVFFSLLFFDADAHDGQSKILNS